MQTFDMIVIGSGPAGQRAAIQGAKSGKRVAVVEKREVLGGACINTGTIPSKTMREAVLHLSGYDYQDIYGVNYRVKEKITMADLAFRVQHVIKTEIDVTAGAALAQQRRSADRHRPASSTPTPSASTNSRGASDLPRREHHHRHRHQAGRLAQGPIQRPQHHQQRPDPADAGDPQDADRGGRRRHRRRIHLHVRRRWACA